MLSRNTFFRMNVILKNRRNYILSWAIKGQFRYCHGANKIDNTVDSDEVKKFSAISQAWWNEGGEFKALHTMNSLRIPLIRDGIVKQRQITSQSPDMTSQSPGGVLNGTQILDVGCGGGILSEPLARLGAQVTGIDASVENIQMAKWHASLDDQVKNNTRYLAKAVEDIVVEEDCSYDAVVASEILEHVADPEAFVNTCCALVKPEGSLFVTTLNRTTLSWALAVVAAERVLRLVPAGAHDWRKFIPPDRLESMLRQNNFQLRLVHGMLLNPFTMAWSWTSDTSMNYALHAIKVT